MWSHKRVVHLRDIRLSNNAGFDFPVCEAGRALLRTNIRFKTSAQWAAVTCARCKAQAPRRYPWARYGKEGGVIPKGSKVS